MRIYSHTFSLYMRFIWMGFDVTFAAPSRSLAVTPLNSPLYRRDDVKSLTNRNDVQRKHRESKIMVEKSEEREVRS